MKLLRVKLFGELTKCIIIASGSILLCNDGTAGSCNLLHGIFLVQGICTQRKPLRKEKQDRDFLFPTMRYWMECIWYVSFLLTPCVCCWLSSLVLWGSSISNSLNSSLWGRKILLHCLPSWLNLGCLEIFQYFSASYFWHVKIHHILTHLV